MRILLLILLVMILPTQANAGVDGTTCQPFYRALEAVPHESIFQRNGLYTSQSFETGAIGCFLVMNTSATRLEGRQLPNLSGEPGTPLYNAGWRINPKYSADGPGTGVVGLEKDDAFCLVYTEQPSYIDDAGQIIQQEYIRVRVECMAILPAGEPGIVLKQKE
jgi:hypothetical protein